MVVEFILYFETIIGGEHSLKGVASRILKSSHSKPLSLVKLQQYINFPDWAEREYNLLVDYEVPTIEQAPDGSSHSLAVHLINMSGKKVI